MTVAMTVVAMARTIVLPNEASSALSEKSFEYQARVKPFQVMYGLVSVALNELATMTAIGRKSMP